MDDAQREFLDALLTTPSPSGFEARGQRHFVDYVEAYADEVRTDAYGNAVAVHEGDEPAIPGCSAGWPTGRPTSATSASRSSRARRQQPHRFHPPPPPQ